MIDRKDKLADRKVTLKRQLIKKHGIRHTELIEQIVEKNADLLYNENPLKEAEKMLRLQAKDFEPSKTKLLVKPHIVKKIQALQKKMEYANNSLTKSTHMESEPARYDNLFEANNRQLEEAPRPKNGISKVESQWRLLSDNVVKDPRKRHTIMVLPSASSKELGMNFETFKPVQEVNQKQQTKKTQVSINNNKPQNSNDRSDNLKKLGPAVYTKPKPKSLLKTNIAVSLHKEDNKIFLNRLDRIYNEALNSEIEDEILKDIDKSYNEQDNPKRGKSVGNFITGRGTHSLRRLGEKASFEASCENIDDEDINLELDEIREMASREGSFISQDLFKQKKPAKKDNKTEMSRKGAKSKPINDRSNVQTSKQFTMTPIKSKNVPTLKSATKELSTGSKVNRPTNFIKKSESKVQVTTQEQKVPRGMKRVSEVDGLIKDFVVNERNFLDIQHNQVVDG